MLPVIIVSTDAIERELSADPRLSTLTRRGYLSDLKSFEAWRGSMSLTQGTVEAYIVHLKAKELSPTSINRKLSAVRWWVKRLLHLAYEGNMPQEQLQHIQTHAQRILDIRGMKGNHQRVGQHISDERIKALLSQIPSGIMGLRDAALITLAWATGLRRHEIVNLQTGDILFTDDCAELTVIGKGDKVRVAYVCGSVLTLLKKWLDARGHFDGPVFPRIIRGGRVTSSTLSGEGMAHILRKYTDVGWHDFRRTFAGRLLDKGADLVTVQGMMGHRNVSTTANYDRRGERAKRAAARLMEL